MYIDNKCNFKQYRTTDIWEAPALNIMEYDASKWHLNLNILDSEWHE